MIFTICQKYTLALTLSTVKCSQNFLQHLNCLYLNKNNADNSIKIAFTNSEVPKIIHTFLGAPIKKTLEKTDERVGKRVSA